MADSTACASQPPDYCGNISIPRMDPEVEAGFDIMFWVLVITLFRMMALPLAYVITNYMCGETIKDMCQQMTATTPETAEQRKATRRAREVVVIGGKV